PWVGLALIIGNRYPCFHGFRGGKGVASYLGFGAALSPISSMLSCIVWVILFSIIRIPFIASFFMTVTIATGTIFTFSREPAAIIGVLATALLIFYNHKTNIEALREKVT
ncbi:MAG: glycerol-3-phosphate acyltransferase, partial [Deltaproteobacteria bacterium]|nr:glycerol-3-phosphate acyltransferase [Deltaproteobacteria bacterium]